VKLDPESRRILGTVPLGMLAVKASTPLVNPLAYHFDGEHVWMTTSRYATKLRLARRDPRAGFMVTYGERTVLLRGLLDVVDPRSVGGAVGAALEGPRFAFGLAGYGLKNLGFAAGYVVDLARVPSQWWPHNRVVLRLKVANALVTWARPPSPATSERVPAVPAGVARAFRQIETGFLCWYSGGYPTLVPSMWAIDGDRALVVPTATGLSPRTGSPSALVIEYHHRYRASRMVGACLRGSIRRDPRASRAVADRYGISALDSGLGYALDIERVTWWRGFQVRTAAVASAARPRAAVR
jgi:hypothetical protein